MTVQHLLVTRFNLRQEGLKWDKLGNPVLGPDWMRERIGLFEHYCAPSVRAQTLTDFTWLILMDRDTSQESRARLGRVVAGMPNVEFIYLPPISTDVSVAEAVLQRTSGEPDVLLTTRLDNDDAIHQDALAVVREKMRPDRREFLNLRFGYVTDGETARVKSNKYGHFATLVEPRAAGSFRTVHCGLPHGRAHSFAPYRQITDQPYWLELIHPRNAANRGFGEIRTYDRSTLRGWHRWLRFEVIAPARRQLWPTHYRRSHRLVDIAGPFNLG